MTAELLDEATDDARTVVVAWLQPLRRTAAVRRSGDPLPFTLVTDPGVGNESVEESWADVVVSVHTLSAKSLGEANALDETNKTHQRMLLLARYLEDVDLPDGSTATIESVSVFTRPHFEPYGDDQIIRYVGRYTIGLSYREAVYVS